MDRLNLQLWLLHGHPAPVDAAPGVDRTGLRLTRRRATTCAERFSLALLDLIGSGAIPPGARLPTERAVAERMHLSRACVRSALDTLKGNGFVKGLQGSANRVPDAGDPGSGMIAALVEAHRRKAGEFARLRLSFDGPIAREAALNADAQRRAAFLASVRAGAPGDRFYPALVDASRNVVAGRIAASMSSTIAALEAGFARSMRDPGDAELRTRVAEAVAARDADGAGAWMARYAGRVAACQAQGLGRPRGADHPDEILALLTPLEREPLPTAVSARMLDLMRFGNLKPGDPLPSERILADALGISRVSVRSALGRLKAERWVAAIERDGTRVVSLPDAPDALSHDRHSAMVVGDLFRVRSILETLSAEMAAECASAADLDALDTIQREMKRKGLSQRRFIDLDIGFHQGIARASGSGVNIFLGEILADHLGPYFERGRWRGSWTAERDGDIIAQHDAIVAAVRARDARAARAAMLSHMSAFARFYAFAPDVKAEGAAAAREAATVLAEV